MSPDRHARAATAPAGAGHGEIEVTIYPARVGRAGDGRPHSPTRAYRLPEDPGRAAEAVRTAGSRRTVARTVMPPAPVLPAAPRPAPSVTAPPAPTGRSAFARGVPPAREVRRSRGSPREQHQPRHLAPGRWYRRLALDLLRVARGRGPGSRGG